MECEWLHTPRWKKSLVAFTLRALNKKLLAGLCDRTGGVTMISRICIKSTGFTTLSEAYAMEFVRRNTSIPVPKVYCAFERKGRVYIVMRRIKAPYVAHRWVYRSKQSQQKVLQQLKAMLEELRALEAPEGVGVASTDHGPIYDPRLPERLHWGPYSTIREFHQALTDGHDLAAVADNEYPGLQELGAFYQQSWPRTVFTHGDLSSLNILCQGDKVVGIVDWETAGWLPPYWEYVTAWNVNPQNMFWQEEVDKFLTPWPHALEMDAVRRKYYGLF